MNSEELWRVLEVECKGKEGETIARDASPASLSSVLLALESPARNRILFVEIPFETTHPLQAKTRGLTITSVRFGNPQKRWLKFVCNDPQFNHIFSKFSDEIIEMAERVNPNALVQELELIIKEILVFFSEERTAVLSLKEQQGLFAELHFLREHILPYYDGAFLTAVKSWMGPLGAIHDFHFGNRLSVEVKSYSTNNEKRLINISRPEQLETLESSCLLLYAEGVVTSSSSGKSLSVAIEEIENILKKESIDAFYCFRERVTKCGYSVILRDEYDSFHFTITDESLFEVMSGFPRIQRGNLSKAIENVKYSLDIGQCSSFSTEVETLYKMLRGC